MTIENDFSNRLKEVRLMRGLSQQQLAQRLNNPVTKAQISHYEVGLSTPPLDTLLDVGNILNVSTDYLLGRTDDYLSHMSKNSIPTYSREKINEAIRILKEL
ncbi:hypothetical protein COK00_11825 [Bacillus cereus]|uniref:helix-turn-helix domain-containing protein n=1 Tax=Bacillus cereus TaxID=1396 RepID=UPI000BF99184|nr:helix-turn-helix transcriptional regulator [Bacillus cereus]PFB64305.1 hypothetical protein CN291_16500 [Bacillus cereus]PFP65284.1 hypothetical protein COK00_11825 [Bacillus cereus]PGT10156.1 hypothetical protein COD03_20525 [Bacillus cereus]